MNEPFWAQFISSAVVPVVIISACGLLCLAFYNRLAAILTRLRNLQHERFHEYKDLFQLEEKAKSSLTRHEIELYLHFLERQTADVLKKAHYIRTCLGFLLGAICSLVLCSLAIGLSMLSSIFDWAVLLFFVLGLILMICGLIFAFAEVRISLKPIQMESAFLQKLIKTQAQSQ